MSDTTNRTAVFDPADATEGIGPRTAAAPARPTNSGIRTKKEDVSDQGRETRNAIIELRDVSVRFGSLLAVDHASLSVRRGEIFGIIGFSGAGKSTLVRTINLLQAPSSGSVRVDGTTLFSGEQRRIGMRGLREQRRKIGMVFQYFNLLDEWTVADNVAFALKHSRLTDEQADRRIERLLRLVGLEGKAGSYPSELSGGQKQRVAIARALANEPEILLCDEATSALDPKTAGEILDLLSRLRGEIGLTIVLITHQMEAVKRIADRVAVMERGRIIEQGRLREVALHPRERLTREFVGGALETEKALSAYHLGGLGPDTRLLQLTYGVGNVNQSVIVELYRRFSLRASILYGNVDVLAGEPVGTLVVLVGGPSETLARAGRWLDANGVAVRRLDPALIDNPQDGSEDADPHSANAKDSADTKEARR